MKTRTLIPLALVGYTAAMYCVGGWVAALVLLCLFAFLIAFASLCYWLTARLMEWIDRSDMPADTTGEDQP